MDQARIDELIAVYRDGLLDDVVPFWIKHCVDREHGGFTFALDRDGTVVDDDKNIWTQGRFTWLLAHLYNDVEQRDEWLELAKHGYDFIRTYGFDPEDGRMWFMVTRDGKPLRKRRYAFTETFAVVAYAAYAKASGDDEAATAAGDLFRRYNAFLKAPPVIPPKWTDNRPMKSLAVPMINIVTAQVLRDAIADPVADDVIDQAIDELRRDFVKPDLEVVMETVGPNGEIIDHFDGRTLNPGHAIEGAWFILREAKHRNRDKDLIQLGCQMLDYMWKRGWDEEYGGMLYFRDVYHKPVQEYWHDMKFWWPQNETIVAALLAYQLTGDEKYADWHRQLHDWTYRCFPDPEYGEWFGYLHRDGRVSVPLKGNMWKGPFHIPRMQWQCWRILEEMKRSG